MMGEDDYYTEAKDALSLALAKYNELKQKGVKCEAKTFSQAKSAMNKKNYEKAFEYAMKYIEEMESQESQPEVETEKALYMNLLRRVVLTEEIAGEAHFFGLDGSKCTAVIEEAIESLRKKSYEEASDWLRIAESYLPYVRFPYYHGVEMEIQVVKKDGRWIEGAKVEDIFTTIVLDSKDALEELLGREEIPRLIKEPVKGIYIQNITKPGHNRGLVMMIKYRVDEKDTDIEVIGRDAHGSGVTWILEIATPPCKYAQQLDWWLHTLFKVCYETVKKHPNTILISSGINAIEPFSEGFSFGDHHHIGIPDDGERKSAYNLLRNYLPYLTGMSVNSPIVNGNLPDIVVSPANIILLPSLTDPLSIRLKVNQRQLGPNDESRYVPYLRKDDDVEMFRKCVEYATIYDARFVDIFPFTRFNTIEVRVFDAQLIPRDRVAQAIILQALALRGVREGKERGVAEVSPRTLVKNRERAFLKGLMMGIYKDKDLRRRALKFCEIYQEKKFLRVDDEDDKLHYLIDGCRNMLWYIRDELLYMGGEPFDYLSTYMITLFGGDRNIISPPITPGQFQLYILKNACKGDINIFMSYMEDISRKVCENVKYNPMVEVFGNATVPEQLKRLWEENPNKGETI